MPSHLLIHGRIKSAGSRSSTRADGGAALIIVLTCLVLVAALAIALLNRVEADRSSSAAYKGGANSRNLSEYAVNVVMAQIASATTGANAGNAWASQPGAIRVYANNAATLTAIYKLYSSTSMVVNAFPTGDTNTTGWSSSPALYTDLNAPLTSWRGTNLVTNYPILDPTATNSVQGFAISGAPNATTNQPAPMPVNWLYVLQDGTLVAPTAGTSNTVTVTGATAANPITGRIAFWTDDETCKVNINTAAGAPWSWATNNNPNNAPNYLTAGSTPNNATLFANYWDTPIVGSSQDHNLTWSQPWAGEYQRFPGHPATVSLSAVFTNLTTSDIMAIAPRINYGPNGSQWGMSVTTNLTGASKILSDGSRLYANVDELLYATNRSATGTNPLTATTINQARFFLTTSSRAPDVTLFNTPRLLVWPVNTSTTKQTPYDKLIAFDGTVGANTNIGSINSYYFTRGNAFSPTADYGISRNGQLLTYLKKMTTTAVPGFGGSSGILGKYGVDSEQIRTEIFDYIRCINLQDNSMGTNTYWYSTNGLVVPTTGTGGTMGFGRMPTITKAALMLWYNTNVSTSAYIFSNSTTHTVTTNTSTNVSLCARILMESFIPAQGFPSLPLLGGSLPFSVNASGLIAGNAFRWGPNTGSLTNIFPTDTCSMTNYQSDYYPGMGGVMNYGCFRVTVPQNTVYPSFPLTNYIFSGGYLTNTNTATGISVGTGTVSAGNGTFTYTGGSTPATGWIYVGTSANSNAGTLSLGGGTLTLATSYAGTTLQTSSLAFPSATNLPLPQWIDPGTNADQLNGTIRAISTDPKNQDVVRGVQYTSGDYRLLAATPTVGVSLFTNHPYYFNTNTVGFTNLAYAHTFRYSSTVLHNGATVMSNSYYVPGSTTLCKIPYTVNTWANGDMITNSTNGGSTLLTQYGDFDNGYGISVDGPYIGFCDEGAISAATGPSSIPYFSINPATNVVIKLTSGFFSPNRLVPSAGVMGSLSTGVKTGNPWQTLLFRPAALTAATHPGLATPPDYLLLDLFNMPVVEPYAISEPLSTAGQINMNYQILPFSWIKRSTAVQAALQTEYLTGIPVTPPAGTYTFYGSQRKHYNADLSSTNRFPLNLNTNTGTLAGFEQRFSTNGIFVSASEICSIPLVPAGSTYANIATWWNGYTYTGDNSKERPYARIYPKLTTKSNVYTVHYTVQTLKKLPSGTQTLWDETKDKVLSTYRGSTTIERYVNPRDPSIPDYTGVSLPLQANDANALPYKFRIISQRQFSP